MSDTRAEEKIFDLPPAIYGAGYVGMTRAHYESLQRENRVLALKNSGSLANNLCPDHRDKQTGKPCLACEIERLRTAAYQACSDMGCFCDGEDLPDDAKCAMCKLEKVLHG